MKKLHVRKGGFTLIELMIVVAIIGILAAIAIPNFLRFQLKAKSSEGKTNLAAIRTAEQSYYSEFGRYVSSQGLGPTAYPGSSKTGFVTTSGFNTIGWSPEGQVYFNYGVGADALGTGFFATAMADIDANLTPQAWGYHKRGAGGAAITVQTGHTCALGATGLQQDDQVGPCGSTFGQSVF
jgi:type IV pilus assembly protein PilA